MQEHTIRVCNHGLADVDDGGPTERLDVQQPICGY